MKEVFNKDEIKILFRRCTSCSGNGYTLISSHDCWGKDESYHRACSSCNGYGFTIRPDFVKVIKETIL